MTALHLPFIRAVRRGLSRIAGDRGNSDCLGVSSNGAPSSLPFVDSAQLIGEPAALRQRFAADGHIFMKGVVPADALLELRRQIVDVCVRHHWLKPGSDPMDAIAWTVPKVEDEEDYLVVYDDIQKIEAFHALAHDPSIVRVMRALLGPTAFPHPLSICRLVFPDIAEWSTPPHQDFPNNQGARDLYACWIPLADCTPRGGSLSVLEGSHLLGILPRRRSLGPGHRTVAPDPRMDPLTWRTGDFRLGDMIVFHSLTVHRAEPNMLDRLRISVDYRYQREGDQITRECLRPHFGRLSWEQIYDGWQRQDLRYYWKDKELDFVDWDFAFNDEQLEDFDLSVQWRLAFNKRREEMASRYT